MKLYIGNKTYSSWSMRPWVLIRALDIQVDEVWVPFDGFTPDAEFKKTMAAIHPMATVPVLEDNGVVIADSLAIVEYMAEAYPEKQVWPADRIDRAQARQAAAVMHAGFSALRGLCPMNIGADLTAVGARLMAEHQELRDDLTLLDAVLSPFLGRYPAKGEDAQQDDGFLLGAFCAVDAFYAPVMTRIQTYGLPVSDALRAYQSRVLAHPAVAAWCADARAENIFLDFEEPYRPSPDG